jgi:MFS family permease
MKKRILSVVAGALTAIALLSGVELLSPLVFPIPAHIDMNNPQAVADMVRNMPVGAFLMILAGYVLGAFCGGWVAARIADENKMRSALIVGLVLVVGGIINFMQIPHPLWFVISSMACYLAFSYLGGSAGEQMSRKN